MNSLRRSLWVLSALALVGSSACGTTAPPAEPVPQEQPALLLALDTHELHYRAGRVFVVDRTGKAPEPLREVTTYEQFRGLYQVRKGEEIPPALPERGLALNGWIGLDCVREGQACGRQPERHPDRGFVRLRILFPNAPRTR